MIERGGWVYIMSSHSRCLYVGVTSDLRGRVWEHKNGVYEGFNKNTKRTPSSIRNFSMTSNQPSRARNN